MYKGLDSYKKTSIIISIIDYVIVKYMILL